MHKPEGLQDEIIFYDTIAYYVPLQTTDRWSNLIHSTLFQDRDMQECPQDLWDLKSLRPIWRTDCIAVH